jgi:outer membrane protein OmpA-like peptidoglycan-associated protein
MKNLLSLYLFFASTILALAQSAPKRSISVFRCDDYGMEMSERNDADTTFGYYNSNTAGTEKTNTHPAIADPGASEPAMEVFTALHLNMMDLKTNCLVNTDIDIFYNSDFIKGDSGKTIYGEYDTRLKNLGWYYISATAPGYFPVTDTIWVNSEIRRSIVKNLYLISIEVGSNLTLNSINFNLGKTSLTEQSFVELDREALFLIKNPNVVFEIAGHTDSDGSSGYNLILSQGRATVVVDYLISKGAVASQLMARGYGETKPRGNNDTKLGKTDNRRVEFTVLSMGVSLVNE